MGKKRESSVKTDTELFGGGDELPSINPDEAESGDEGSSQDSSAPETKERGQNSDEVTQDHSGTGEPKHHDTNDTGPKSDNTPTTGEKVPENPEDAKFSELVDHLMGDITIAAKKSEREKRLNSRTTMEVHHGIRRLRMVVEDAYGVELNKTDVVEVALRIALKDVQSRRHDSYLVKALRDLFG